MSQGVAHQYQILGDNSEMAGLIVPGGWEEFFRFLGDPYNGPTWPLHDQRDVFEVLIPRLKAASEKFDMIPIPDKKHFEPTPWKDTENRLPGKLEPYFLKNATGPAYLTGGTIVRPLVTTAESDGRFVIGCIEGSKQHAESHLFAANRRLKFPETHHAFQVVDGAVDFEIGTSGLSTVHNGEIIYVPRDTPFNYQFHSRLAKMYCFASGPGVVELLIKAGETYSDPVVPEKANTLESQQLQSAVKACAGEIC